MIKLNDMRLLLVGTALTLTGPASVAFSAQAPSAAPMRAGGQLEGLRRALLGLFGAGQPLDLEAVDRFESKVVQYTSELPGAVANR